MVWTVYNKVELDNKKKMGFGGSVGRWRWGDMGLGKGVKRGNWGGMGHRLINDACWVSHQGFFHGNKSNLAL